MNSSNKFLNFLYLLWIVCSACSYENESLVAVRDGKKLSEGSKVRFLMSSVYPSPVQNSGLVSMEIPSTQQIKLSIYSEDWQELRVLYNTIYSPGSHDFKFTTNNLASGIYYLVATCEDETQVVSFIHVN